MTLRFGALLPLPALQIPEQFVDRGDDLRVESGLSTFEERQQPVRLLLVFAKCRLLFRVLVVYVSCAS